MSKVDFSKFVSNRLASLVSFVNTGTDILSTNVQGAISELAGRNFGKSFNQAFTTGVFTTSSTTFQTMQTIPTYNVASGNYIIFSHGRYLKSLISAQVGARIQVNGNSVIDEEEISLDDDDFFFGHTMLTYVPNLSGNISINSQVRKIAGGGSVSVASRTLIIWRVS